MRVKAWYANNKTRHRAVAKAWSEAHPEKMREYHAAWLAKPGNKVKAKFWVAAWVKANPEKMHAYQHRWYVENADASVRSSGRARLYAAHPSSLSRIG